MKWNQVSDAAARCDHSGEVRDSHGEHGKIGAISSIWLSTNTSPSPRSYVTPSPHHSHQHGRAPEHPFCDVADEQPRLQISAVGAEYDRVIVFSAVDDHPGGAGNADSGLDLGVVLDGEFAGRLEDILGGVIDGLLWVLLRCVLQCSGGHLRSVHR